MTVVVMIFMIVASVFAIASLGYVAVDVVLEMLQKKEPEPVVVVPVVEPEPEPEPEPVPEPEPEIIPVVEHIDAEEADALITDTQAMQTVIYESGAGHGKQGIINLGLINEKFDSDEVITLELLKQRGLVPKKVGRLKVLADGILEKPITVKSESYSVQAIKMIELTGGKVIILRD